MIFGFIVLQIFKERFSFRVRGTLAAFGNASCKCSSALESE